LRARIEEVRRRDGFAAFALQDADAQGTFAAGDVDAIAASSIRGT